MFKAELKAVLDEARLFASSCPDYNDFCVKGLSKKMLNHCIGCMSFVMHHQTGLKHFNECNDCFVCRHNCGFCLYVHKGKDGKWRLKDDPCNSVRCSCPRDPKLFPEFCTRIAFLTFFTRRWLKERGMNVQKSVGVIWKALREDFKCPLCEEGLAAKHMRTFRRVIKALRKPHNIDSSDCIYSESDEDDDSDDGDDAAMSDATGSPSIKCETCSQCDKSLESATTVSRDSNLDQSSPVAEQGDNGYDASTSWVSSPHSSQFATSPEDDSYAYFDFYGPPGQDLFPTVREPGLGCNQDVYIGIGASEQPPSYIPLIPGLHTCPYGQFISPFLEMGYPSH